MSAIRQADAAPEGVWPSVSVAWWTVAVMVATAFLCTMDRLVLNLLVDPIRADLGISETQFSLLQGASFTIVNALAALPLGLLADRSSRRYLMVFGVLVWSLATTAGGLTHNFQSFFFSRIMVGLGEAALWPVSVSLIANLLPPEKRGRAISLVMLGQIIGGGASLIMTGAVLKLSAGHGFDHLAVIADLAPWRVVLVLWGFLGAPVTFLLLTTKEPVRRITPAVNLEAGGLRRFVRFIGRRWRLLAPMYLGSGCISIGSYAMAAWVPSFFIRRFAMHASELGPILGLMGIVSGACGAALAGFIADQQEKRARPDCKLMALTLAAVACLPVATVCIAPNFMSALIIQSGAGIFFPISGALCIIVMQDVLPDDMRGKGMAVLALVSSLFGATFGPTLVAMATQYVFIDPALVGYSIALVIVPSLLVAAASFHIVRKQLHVNSLELF